jgi:small multidrug resistance pump
MSAPAISPPRWMTSMLRAAGIYNLAWGAWVVLWPAAAFRLAGMPEPNYPELWQCIGMIVGVYGIGYWIAARDPARHWPIVLVGLLGKLFGPIGFLDAAIRGRLPWIAGLVNITNDLIWLVPFVLVLVYARRVHVAEETAGR